MDTSTKSFDSLNINSPNPTVNFNPNPGQYYVTMLASAGPDVDPQTRVSPLTLETEGVNKQDALEKDAQFQLQAVSAGFIFMATWA